MTKKELVSLVAGKTLEKKVLVEEVLDAIFETIAEKVTVGESISIPSFGKFIGYMTSPRECALPNMKGKVSVPKMKLKFKQYGR
jgi:nucleoid DNA-binding protein